MEILLLLVVGSSLWMAIDSSSLGGHRNGAHGVAATHPIMWFLAGIIMWIIAFPAYLIARSKMIAARDARNDRNTTSAADGVLLQATSVGDLPAQPAIMSTQPQAPAALQPPDIPAAWHSDPTGRFELRWWDGHAWTQHVSTNGVTTTDAGST